MATDPVARRHGVGRAVCAEIIEAGRRSRVARLLRALSKPTSSRSLEFGRWWTGPEGGVRELRSSYDRGVAEFLDLHVKPNTWADAGC